MHLKNGMKPLDAQIKSLLMLGSRVPVSENVGLFIPRDVEFLLREIMTSVVQF